MCSQSQKDVCLDVYGVIYMVHLCCLIIIEIGENRLKITQIYTNV